MEYIIGYNDVAQLGNLGFFKPQDPDEKDEDCE